jgi:hydrogenase expression/formation protein HypE
MTTSVQETTPAATAAPSFDGWTCPLPLREYPTIVLGHGGGGQLSAELVEHLVLPALGGADAATLADSAVLTLPGSRIAYSTDSFVVRPLIFPGGSIGTLAVHGTVNDLAMSGATRRASAWCRLGARSAPRGCRRGMSCW